MKWLICLIRDHRWIFLHTVSTLPLFSHTAPPPITYVCLRCGKIDSNLFVTLKENHSHLKLTFAKMDEETETQINEGGDHG